MSDFIEVKSPKELIGLVRDAVTSSLFTRGVITTQNFLSYTKNAKTSAAPLVEKIEALLKELEDENPNVDSQELTVWAVGALAYCALKLCEKTKQGAIGSHLLMHSAYFCASE